MERPEAGVLGAGDGRAVLEGREGAVAQAGIAFETAVNTVGVGANEAAEAAGEEDGGQKEGDGRKHEAECRRQAGWEVQQGDGDEGAEHAEGRPDGGPQLFEPQRGPGEGTLAGEARGSGLAGKLGGRVQASQAGTCSFAHRASMDWRGRMTDQRPASTMTSAARGRAL